MYVGIVNGEPVFWGHFSDKGNNIQQPAQYWADLVAGFTGDHGIKGKPEWGARRTCPANGLDFPK